MKSTTIGETTSQAVRPPAHAHVNWKEVILFVVLTYGLAWAWSGFFLLPYLQRVAMRMGCMASWTYESLF